jgi:hypothetical protein
MMNRDLAAAAAILFGAWVLVGGAPGPGNVFAQDLDRDRERLRDCDASTQDCDRLQEQITERLRQQLRDCDAGTQECDRLRAELREMEQFSERDRDRERDRSSGPGGGGGAGGGGAGGGGGGGRN